MNEPTPEEVERVTKELVMMGVGSDMLWDDVYNIARWHLTQLAALRKENAELRKDKERLDLLEHYASELFEIRIGYAGMPEIECGVSVHPKAPIRNQCDSVLAALTREKGQP